MDYDYQSLVESHERIRPISHLRAVETLVALNHTLKECRSIVKMRNNCNFLIDKGVKEWYYKKERFG